MKITIEIPDGKYCGNCPCCGLNGKEEEFCGFWHVPLELENAKELKCDNCLNLEKMMKLEGGNLDGSEV